MRLGTSIIFYAPQFVSIFLPVKTVIQTGIFPEVKISWRFRSCDSVCSQVSVYYFYYGYLKIPSKKKHILGIIIIVFFIIIQVGVTSLLQCTYFLWWNSVGTLNNFRFLHPAHEVALTLPHYSPTDISITAVIQGYLWNSVSASCNREC